MLRLLIFLTAFSQIFLNRFGIQITNDFSLSVSYIFLYLSITLAVCQGYLITDLANLLLFSALAASAVISYSFGIQEKSLSSLMLLLFLYLPFVFRPITTKAPDLVFYRLYYPLLVVLALSGVIQFFAQFFVKPEWLFDFRQYLPPFFQNKNPMNTVIPIGSFLKGNGFFLLEPSIFSQWMAYGVCFSGVYPSSVFAMPLFLTGLAVAFSGTGVVLVLLFCIFSFFDIRREKRLLLFVLLFCFLVFSFLTKDTLLLSRLDEFKGGTGVRTTSAAARFINPTLVLQEGWATSCLIFFFGNGPGTIARVNRDFEVHDPVWAKLFFEYGLIGGIILLLFLHRSTSGPNFNRIFRILFFIQWFSLGGHLLTFDVLVLYVMYYKLCFPAT